MMYQLIAVVLLSQMNQLSLGSPLLFPDEVKVDSHGLWMHNSEDGNLEVNVSSLDPTNTPANQGQVILSTEHSYHWTNGTSETESEMIDQGNDPIGNEERNITDLLLFVEDNKTDSLINGHINISSDNNLMRKLMEIRVDQALDVPSDDGTGNTLFKKLRRRRTGRQIFFPSPRNPAQSSPMEIPVDTPIIPMVGPCRDGYMRYQGECSRLLSSRPCGDNEKWWLVMKGHDFAECELRPCPLGQISYQNTCVSPENSSPCSEGQILYVELTGQSFCDCESDYFYNELDGTCVPEHEQGWCNWGYYIVKNSNGIPECVLNPCRQNGYAYYEQHHYCYKKRYSGICEQNKIQIIENEAECNGVVLDLRNIFEVPTLRRCPRGSLRDILHECRRRFTVPSIPSVLKINQLKGQCPTGYTRGPRGRCRKILNLFAMGRQNG